MQPALLNLLNPGQLPQAIEWLSRSVAQGAEGPGTGIDLLRGLAFSHVAYQALAADGGFFGGDLRRDMVAFTRHVSSFFFDHGEKLLERKAVNTVEVATAIMGADQGALTRYGEWLAGDPALDLALRRGAVAAAGVLIPLLLREAARSPDAPLLTVVPDSSPWVVQAHLMREAALYSAISGSFESSIEALVADVIRIASYGPFPHSTEGIAFAQGSEDDEAPAGAPSATPPKPCGLDGRPGATRPDSPAPVVSAPNSIKIPDRYHGPLRQWVNTGIISPELADQLRYGLYFEWPKLLGPRQAGAGWIGMVRRWCSDLAGSIAAERGGPFVTPLQYEIRAIFGDNHTEVQEAATLLLAGAIAAAPPPPVIAR